MSYPIPSVIESTPRGDRAADIFSRLLSDRIVFVGTPIDEGVANVIVAQLLHLAGTSDADIELYVNSPGGSFPAVMAIYDAVQFIAPDVATLCVGQTSGTAAILVAGGAPGKRSSLPHARIILDQPHADGRQGAISDLLVEARELARVRSESERLLALHSGREPAVIRADTERALVLQGQDAVDYGIVDRIVASAGRSLTPAIAPTRD